MKNFKDITISIFAIIGFVTILSSFNNQSQETHSAVPESHVWEAYGAEGSWGWVLNKQTGEVFGLDASRKAKVIVKTITK